MILSLEMRVTIEAGHWWIRAPWLGNGAVYAKTWEEAYEMARRAYHRS